MMQLHISHETRYAYLPAVETAQHLAYLQPQSTPYQQVQSHLLSVYPVPTHINQTLDVFGNPRSFFSLQTPHTSLSVLAISQVLTQARALPPSACTWEQVAQGFVYRAGNVFDAATEFVFPSPHVPQHPDFAAYAAPSFAPGRALQAAVLDLMQRIHSDFVYDSDSSHINTPAQDSLAQRRGVCQDFAHVMLAGLRAFGVAARYVSGYVLTVAAKGQVKLLGGDASHAWVSVYFPDLPPGQRWCDFDPTNNRAGWHAPGADYVSLATGRDFSDVSPLRGVIHGGASHTLTVHVTVQEITQNNAPAAP